MKQDLKTAILWTVVTTVLLGVIYPAFIYGLGQVLFKQKANGDLISRSGQIVGSHMIGQGFTEPGYFWSRPSVAGTGYDAANSSGSNLGPTNKKLVDRIAASTAMLQQGNPNQSIPADLVTTSASGLDPHITPAAANFQLARVAGARHLSEEQVRQLVAKHTEGRQFGFLGESRVNVLELNLDLDAATAGAAK